MSDVGFLFSSRAICRQLEAMPCDSYLIRLIHHATRRPLPGERIWSAAQILREPTIRFLRARNREGFDVYFRPYAADRNAGYILVDLDDAHPEVLTAMRENRHEPCVVIETSAGHFQAWVRVSPAPLPPKTATSISRRLASLYHADRASADWRHVGRLAGFTNQKPKRRLPSGLPPWVKVRYAAVGLASDGNSLVEAATLGSAPNTRISGVPPTRHIFQHSAPTSAPPSGAIEPAAAIALYQTWLNRMRIPQRFPKPDWSIADFWIAKELLHHGVPMARVKSILALASPLFPRSHSDPEDYLQRTLLRAVQALRPFSGAPL